MVSAAGNAINQLATGPIECFSFKQMALQGAIGGVASKLTGSTGLNNALGYLGGGVGRTASSAINYGQSASAAAQNVVSQGANLVTPTSLGGFYPNSGSSECGCSN